MNEFGRAKQAIENGTAVLGMEFGSTRIKAVLIDEENRPIASGGYNWENQLINQIWTYDFEDIITGMQISYQNMLQDVMEKYGVGVRRLGAVGFSGMMHGYMVFDEMDQPLVPFRTWRNTMTEQAADELTGLFQYNIPQRWSIAHLYQAILNGEPHVSDIRFMTTLAGYIHWRLTGKKVLGIGEASGMFPIDTKTGQFHAGMLRQFSALVEDSCFGWKIDDILPGVLKAGENAGFLTEEGARLLDISGRLEAGIPVCPPEGDAGTGMTATNSIAKRTGNVSAGTSIFAMVVLERELSRVYQELDLVTTPDGSLVAMVHCNNGTSDLNAWIAVFREFAEAFHINIDPDELYSVLYNRALEGAPDCGGLLAYNYFSGEHITGFEAGCPLFVRRPDSEFNLANFMRVHLFTAAGTLKLGMDILQKKEGIRLDRMLGHGGFFRTKGVGQRIIAGALNRPVQVMETAGEGGAWGIAVLASYMLRKRSGESLEEYLNQKVFDKQAGTIMEPDPADVEGFETFISRFQEGLSIERAAVSDMVTGSL